MVVISPTAEKFALAFADVKMRVAEFTYYRFNKQVSKLRSPSPNGVYNNI